MILRLPPIFVLTLAAGLSLPAIATAECNDPTGLCVDNGTVKWKSDGTVSGKTIRKERKLRAKAKAKVSVSIDDGGRGTVFLDGRYAGIAPLRSFSLSPGSHEIQVRDGNRILAEGSLAFPEGESVEISINY
ncbi:MAG TPA: hypothetical protein ENJ18_00145 [Nannocystis exedens]|nr:hypothetical protein [Nannocystis exedens]